MTAFQSPFPDVEIPDTPLSPFILQHVSDRADSPALIDGPTGRTYTFAELAGAVQRFAGGLRDRGFGKGDVFGIMLPNVPEYAVAFHGVATAGGTNTTINPVYTGEEVEFQLRDAGARYLLTIPMFLESALEAAGASGVEEVFVLGEADGATPFTELLSPDPYEGHADVDPAEDVVVLPYSSGTTGLPKGVMLTHRNLVANTVQCHYGVDTRVGDVAVAVLPFFHIYGMQVLMNMVLYHGATVVTLPRFDLEQFLQTLQDRKVTHAYLVPPIVLALAKHPLVDQYDLSSLRMVLSGAAPLGPETAREAAERIGCDVVQGYGMTELSPVSHMSPPGRGRLGASGLTISNTEVRVVDPATGEDLGVDEDGEVWVRGPQVMKGYLNNQDATAATIDGDGWLHTGDIGHLDADGYLYIVDRLKELIKFKGFQVPPAELEALLLAHPAVADSAVIPVPDEEAGEIPKAFVVLKPGQSATAEELQDHVAEHVAHYKQIRAVEFVDEIPKSASGKILRRVLRDREAG